MGPVNLPLLDPDPRGNEIGKKLLSLRLSIALCLPKYRYDLVCTYLFKMATIELLRQRR
jgi:hypothetical protein